MKFKNFSAILLVGMLMLMLSCAQKSDQNTHTHGSASHIHAPADPVLEPLSFTVWTTKTELFVEFPPLVAGKESRFAAHFSNMENFKPINKGKVIVRLLAGNQTIEEGEVSAPSSPGIFRPTMSPEKPGILSLQFVLLTDDFNDTITLANIAVYSNAKAAAGANSSQPQGDEISFLKEQAWKIDFAIDQVKRQDIHEVIHTSGEFRPVKAADKIISAKSSGIVFFKSQKLQEGREVNLGEVLFTINSKGLLQSNMEEKYQVAKARNEKTKADFERAEKLLEQQIIGQNEYERRKMDYSIAKAEFQSLTNSYSAEGQTVAASMSGIVKNVLVRDGQFVEEGTPLAELTQNRRLILQAEVAQSFFPKLHLIKSANFRTPYQKEVQSTSDYNGKLISYGKVIEEGSSFIPVLFELDNLYGLIPGSFAELFLLTAPIKDALVIPRSALMQDYSLNYVYVQKEGESFEKREIKLGIDDGVNVQILSGLTEGEWVVIKGAYQIKMASMSSTIPAHGHEH